MKLPIQRKWLPAVILVMLSIAGLIVALTVSPARSASHSVEHNTLFYQVKAEEFQSAINYFGADTPERAAQLWAQGIQTRNGALQYAVMSDALQKEFVKFLDNVNQSWVTGTSSPYVSQFRVENVTEENGRAAANVWLDYATSTGSMGSFPAKLILARQDDFWRITGIQMGDTLRDLIPYPTLTSR